MDYEKKYKDAQKWIESIYSELSHEQQMEAEAFFPELQESKDERIRKEIIETFKILGDGKIPVDINYADIFTWLEKQGEQKVSVVDFKAKDWYVSKVDGKIYNAKFMEKTPNNQARRLEIEKAAMSATGIIEQEEWFIKGAEWSDKNPSYINSEKQGEQKSIDDLTQQEAMDIAVAKCFEQGEQNLVDKVEANFHEGDWVVTSYGKVNQVIAVDEDCDGFTLDDYTYFSGSWKDGYHLWTIKDAKDGDVLCVKYGNDEMPFIFTGKQDDVAYCALNSFGEFVLSIAEWLLKISVLPATKEQRDLLFTKMKEAGFEWDSEKKELKKIEDEEYDGEDYGIDGLYHAQRILEKTLGKVNGYQTDDGILDHKVAIDTVKKLYEQKPTEWKQENVEELSDFENAMMHIGGSFFGENAGLDPNDTSAIKEQANLLLELVPKTEWSEEDEKRLKSCLNILQAKGFMGITETINTKWLKSLKQRYTWKPSDEQMRAFEQTYDWYNTHSAQNIALNSLYNDLKKLKGE